MKRPSTLPEEAPSLLRARLLPADPAEAGLASERLPILDQAEEFGASLISRPMFVVGAVPGRSWRKRPFFNADYDPVYLREANTQGPVFGPVCRLDLVTALDPRAAPRDPAAPPLPCAQLQPPPANPSSDTPPPAAGAASPSITPDALPFLQAADIDPIDQLYSLLASLLASKLASLRLSPLNLLDHTPSPCSAMGGSLAAGVRSEAAPCPSHPTYTPDITPLDASLTVEVMPCPPHPSLDPHAPPLDPHATPLDPHAPPLDPHATPLGPHAPPLPCARLQPPPPANPSSDAPPPAAGAASPSITPDALPFPQAADIDPIVQLCSLLASLRLSLLNLLGHTPSPCSAMGGSLAAGVRSEAAPCPSHPTYTPDITPLEASLTVEVMLCPPHPSLAGASRLGTAAHVPTAGTSSRAPPPVASRAAAGAAAALPLLRATLAASRGSTSPGLTARPNAPPGTLTLAHLPHPAPATAAAVDNTAAAAPAPAPAVSIGLTHHPLFLRGRLREVAGRPMTRSTSSSSYFGPQACLEAPAHVPAKAA